MTTETTHIGGARTFKGFTLVELMVVVAILSIMAAMSVPSLMRLSAKQAVSSAGAQLTSVLARARIDAMMRGRCVCVMVNQNGGSAAEKFITLRRKSGFDCDSATKSACDGVGWEAFGTGPQTEPPTLVDQANIRIGAVEAGPLPTTSMASNVGPGTRVDVLFRPTGRLWSTSGNYKTARVVLRVQHTTGPAEDFVVCNHGAVRRATEGC